MSQWHHSENTDFYSTCYAFYLECFSTPFSWLKPTAPSTCSSKAFPGKASEIPKLDEEVHKPSPGTPIWLLSQSATASFCPCDWSLTPSTPLCSKANRFYSPIFPSHRSVPGLLEIPKTCLGYVWIVQIKYLLRWQWELDGNVAWERSEEWTSYGFNHY
jgi:hypothetical protein